MLTSVPVLSKCYEVEFAQDVSPTKPGDVILKYLEMLIGDEILIDADGTKVETCPDPDEFETYKDVFQLWVIAQLKR